MININSIRSVCQFIFSHTHLHTLNPGAMICINPPSLTPSPSFPLKIDRENRVLREAKTSLEMENEQLKRKVEHLSSELSMLLKEHTTSVSEKTNEISELRASLKMKIFELTALGDQHTLSILPIHN